jgi:flagellar transcriptional activator FlhD
MLRLGLSAQIADVLLAMSLAEVLRIAASNFVLCAFRLDEQSIVQSVMQGQRPSALQQAHISIVLAGAHAQAARAA